MRICPECQKRHDARDWCCPACGWVPDLGDGVPILHPPEAGGAHFLPEHFAFLASVEDRHFWFQARNRLILETLKRFAGKNQPVAGEPTNGAGAIRYLEIGCGTGYVLRGVAEAFPEWRISGADYYPEGLGFARDRVPTAGMLQFDACRMPFENEFDTIGLFDVLEHIRDDINALRGIRQALKPAGVLVLTVPQHPQLWNADDALGGHQRRYTRKDLFAKAEESGLRPIWWTSFVTLLLPFMFAVRRGREAGIPAPDAVAQFSLPGWQNALCAAAMRLESVLLHLGAQLPWGGSLIAVFARH
jgi:SAM-dependent methyltransferase